MTARSQDDDRRQAGEPLVHIFADESCLGNQFEDRANPGGAAGQIERFDERKGWYRRDFARFEADTTNNKMALLSGIVSLKALKRPCRVVFTSDSQYLVKGMTEWIFGWSRRGWKRKGGEVENLALWKELAGAAARHQIDWRWTRGHDEDVKNEYANWLAVRTAKERVGIEGLAPSSFAEWLEAEQERGRYLEFLDLPDATPFKPGRPPPAT